MPDNEFWDESGVPEEESSVSVEPTQEQEPSSDEPTNETEDVGSELYPEDFPDEEPEESSEEVLESEFGDFFDEPSDENVIGDGSSDEGSSVSANEIDYEHIQDMINKSVSENYALYFSEDYVVLDDFEEFESSTVLVDRYQYAVLERLEFLQYALAIVIALLFLILFMRYKK